MTIKEFHNDRELARKEKEAKKLAATKSNGEEEAEKVRRPEPKFEDYTVPRPQGGADKKKAAEEDMPSLVEKAAEKLKPKKESAADAVAGSTPAETEAGVASAKAKRDKAAAAATVLGSVTAASGEEYLLPTLDLLEQPPSPGKRDVMEDLKASARVLRETLQEFGIEAESGDVTKGPTVTLFELSPRRACAWKRSRRCRTTWRWRCARKRCASSRPCRAKARWASKCRIHHERPYTCATCWNRRSGADSSNAIPILLGRDVKGNPIIGDLANMPDLLIAGATGSGKTVCVNAILASLLYRFTAEDLRLVLIDPKMVEMQHYNALPHLIVPVVTEAKRCRWRWGG